MQITKKTNKQMFLENGPNWPNMNLLEVLFTLQKGIMCTFFYSVNPVKIYVYEEGLVRFATVVSKKKKKSF
jgi:hypothetical protein